jgi:predicted metal-binding membrane protein
MSGAMSMGWMPMCGPTWSDSALSFLGMWIVMMAAMMLPSLAPMLQRYRRSLGGWLTALVGAGYFCVWGAIGIAVFPLLAIERDLPIPTGLVVLVAGLFQFTKWKARRLACCREAVLPSSADAGTAWRHGLRLGLDCVACCANLTAILLVVGIMDLATMAFVTAAITLERLAPAGEKAARATGVVIVGTGLVLIARAGGVG